jgi:hypothetical protein
MKRKFLLLALLCLSMASWAQTDTTQKNNEKDTIRVGNMLIVKDGKFSGLPGIITGIISHPTLAPTGVSLTLVLQIIMIKQIMAAFQRNNLRRAQPVIGSTCAMENLLM